MSGKDKMIKNKMKWLVVFGLGIFINSETANAGFLDNLTKDLGKVGNAVNQQLKKDVVPPSPNSSTSKQSAPVLDRPQAIEEPVDTAPSTVKASAITVPSRYKKMSNIRSLAYIWV